MSTATFTLSPSVSIVSGSPVVSSLSVAEHFEKRHKHVLDSIRQIMGDTPEDFNEPNFRPVAYLDAKGESRPSYNLSRDGFTLLAMGFTGKKALAWKVRYIEAFNAMEAQLRGRPEPCTQEPITTAQRDRLREIMDICVRPLPEQYWAEGYREGWTRFHRNFDVSSYERLPRRCFDAACNWLTALDLDVAVRARRRQFEQAPTVQATRSSTLDAVIQDVARYALVRLARTMPELAS